MSSKKKEHAKARGPGKSPVPESPIEEYLTRLHSTLSGVDAGSVASYIPELSKAKPDWFGISIATVDGNIYSVGDAKRPFTIQSVSKPFLYGYALREYGSEFVLNHVGVEPTGEAFNAIVLDEINNRPFNPMVNAGAMAIAELMKGDTSNQRRQNMLNLFAQFAGHELTVNDAVFRSESETGHRNRGIAYMMLNSGMISRDPEDILDLYFQQCSINVTCEDLSVMAATLANDGINPLTRESVLASSHVRDVLTVMNSCGMYNYAGQWAYEVGIPAKSGVSGAIIAVIPGQLGIGIYSPPVDTHGNSVRGVRVCQEISNEFSLHVFNNRTNVRSVIRREYRGNFVSSNRLRTPDEREVLEKKGGCIAVEELQGALFFGSVERLMRRVSVLAKDADYLIFDFKRVNLADSAATKLIQHLAVSLMQLDVTILMSHLRTNGPLIGLREHMAAFEEIDGVRLFADTDSALEWCEDRILSEQPDSADRTKFALNQLDIFRGLGPEEYKMVESIIQPFHFEKGDVIVREGDDATLFYVVARGTVSVSISMLGEDRKRVACVGPGLTFGEMALLDGGKRSADVIADDRVVCYGLSVDRIHELSKDHPNIMITILSNMTRDFSERLRCSNEEMRALD